MDKRRIRDPQTGKFVVADVIPVTGLTDPSFTLTLEDGSEILIKVDILEVARLPELWDPDGNPRYFVRSSNTMAVIKSSEELRQPE